MKKAYVSPKAEKTEFNYSDVVVASGSIKCGNTTTYKDTNDISLYCQKVTVHHEVKDVY